jgi:hypothetical protein
MLDAVYPAASADQRSVPRDLVGVVAPAEGEVARPAGIRSGDGRQDRAGVEQIEEAARRSAPLTILTICE